MEHLEGLGDVVAEENVLRPPTVEEVIREAQISVAKMNQHDGTTVTLLQFVTPFKQYTFLLNDPACEHIAENIKPSKVVRATLADLPK